MMNKVAEMWDKHPYLFMMTVTSVAGSAFGALGKIFTKKTEVNITNDLDLDRIAEILKESIEEKKW